MIQHFLLGILRERSLYGYQIKKICDAQFSRLRPINYSSIYPNLKRLMSKGLVTQTVDPQDNRPNRKIYTLTQKGRLEFQEWLLRSGERLPVIHDEFTLKFLFSHAMPKNRVLELIDRQSERVCLWKADLEKMQKENSDSSLSDIYSDMLHELFQEIQNATLHWLDRCRKRIDEISESAAFVLDENSGKNSDSDERTALGSREV